MPDHQPPLQCPSVGPASPPPTSAEPYGLTVQAFRAPGITVLTFLRAGQAIVPWPGVLRGGAVQPAAVMQATTLVQLEMAELLREADGMNDPADRRTFIERSALALSRLTSARVKQAS